MRLRSCTGGLLLAFSLFLSGCGGPQVGDAPDTQTILTEVKELYLQIKESRKRVPARLADLQPFNPVAPTGILALESGDCIAIWGAGLSDAAGAGNAVLAYEKNVPQQGGYVLMQNGEIKKMTAEQFQATPKARK